MDEGLYPKEIQNTASKENDCRENQQVREQWIKLWIKKPFRGGQSFVEFALLLPVILIILLGMIEVAFFIDRYLDVLDLTREAARFASLRDPFAASQDLNCSTPDKFDFYYDTSCMFSPPAGSASCVVDDPFCNGVNSDFVLKRTYDDILISVYTVTDNAVTNVWPAGTGYWAWSDHDSDTVNNANWTRNCQGETIRTVPEYSVVNVSEKLQPNAPPKRGFVAIEAYYCHEQVLGLPIISQFILNPVQIHAYSVMSLPAAQPTATPRP